MFCVGPNRSPPTTHPGDRALNRPFSPFAQDIPNIDRPNLSTFDYFKEFITHSNLLWSAYEIPSGNYIGNLYQSFIGRVDIFEAHIEQDIKHFQWTLTLRDVDSLSFRQRAVWCARKDELESEVCIYGFRCHPEILVHKKEPMHAAMKRIQNLLPMLDLGDGTTLRFVSISVYLLVVAGQHQEAEKAIRAIILEMDRQPEGDASSKSVTLLTLADILISCSKHDHARTIVRDVLGADFPIVATIADTANVKFTTTELLDGCCPLSTKPLKDGNIDEYELTTEGLELIRQHVGEDGIADDIVYVHAILVLQRLNKFSFTDITDI